MKKQISNYAYLIGLLMAVMFIISSCGTTGGGYNKQAYKRGSGCPSQYANGY